MRIFNALEFHLAEMAGADVSYQDAMIHANRRDFAAAGQCFYPHQNLVPWWADDGALNRRINSEMARVNIDALVLEAGYNALRQTLGAGCC